MLLVAVVRFGGGGEPVEGDIYGMWTGTHKNKAISLNFAYDGVCTITLVRLDNGSEETIKGNFMLDFSKDPIVLSIKNVPQLNHPLHTVVRFLSEDTIMVGYMAPRWRLRPVAFGAGNEFRLKRVKHPEGSS
jgi:hypothetical protein